MIKGDIGWMDGQEPEEVCPLLSIANQEPTKCVGWECAMWIYHIETSPQGTTGTGYGHCGLIHPRHEGLEIKDLTDD